MTVSRRFLVVPIASGLLRMTEEKQDDELPYPEIFRVDRIRDPE